MSILAPNYQFIGRAKCPKEHHRIPTSSNRRRVFVPHSSGFGFGFGFGFELRKSRFDCRLLIGMQIRAQIGNEMESIDDTDQLDLILQQARHRNQPIIIEWMASWCRKCIYLKPKLEKLAAEYETKVKFYCVNVNNVPQGLVKRGNISKMPSIQLWEDGEMKAEVIGGQKGYLVMNEVKEMIQPSM